MELEGELIQQVPNGGPVTELGLATTVSRLNARLLREGISAHELWKQRNQFTYEQPPLEGWTLSPAQDLSKESSVQ